MSFATLTLRPDRDKSVMQRRPWIFSGAVERVEGSPESGDTVMVQSADGEALGLAAYSPNSQIRARMWTWDAAQKVDADFLKAKISSAIAMRQNLIPAAETTAIRLVHAESDGIPGLVVDQYGDVLVMQVLTAGVEKWQDEIKDILVELTGAACVYERSDVEVRRSGRTGTTIWIAVWGSACSTGDRGEWTEVFGGCGRRAEDRVLCGSAQKPPESTRSSRRAGCAELFLLHRRVFHLCRCWRGKIRVVSG